MDTPTPTQNDTKTEINFYRALEAYYNDDPKLRKEVETRLRDQALPSLPMTTFDLEDVCDLMRKGLDSNGLGAILPLLSKGIRVGSTPPMVRRKLSPGISVRPAPLPLVVQSSLAWGESSDVVNYAAPRGQVTAIQAIQTLEGLLAGDMDAFPKEGIYILMGGGSNGIFTTISYLSSRFPQSEGIAIGPSYFQFFEQARDTGLTLNCLINQNVKEGLEGAQRFLPTIAEIQNLLTKKTKFICLTNPANPTGEMYSEEELREIFQLASDNDLLVVLDEAFEEIQLDSNTENPRKTPVAIANEMGLLDLLVLLKSFSKGKNMPGARTGYIATKNQDLIRFLEDSMLFQRDCPPNVNTKLICLDSALRAVELCCKGGRSLSDAVMEANELFPTADLDVPVNEATAEAYILQRRKDMYAYTESLRATMRAFSKDGFSLQWSVPQGGYNVLIRTPDLPRGTKQLSFAQRAFCEQGVETQWGPNFDRSARPWEEGLGPWVRVTFSSSPEYLEDSASRLKQLF